MTRLTGRLNKIAQRQQQQAEKPLGIVVRDDEPLPELPPGREVRIIRLPRWLSEEEWLAEQEAVTDDQGQMDVDKWYARHPAYTRYDLPSEQ